MFLLDKTSIWYSLIKRIGSRKFLNQSQTKNDSQKEENQSSSTHNKLEEEWDLLINQKDKRKKGKQFELFITKLFPAEFLVVEVNYLSRNGEFDIIIENKVRDPFWMEFNTDYIIECKYWSRKIPISQVQIFTQKVQSSRAKLGFLISLSGFTKDALEFLNSIISNRDSPIIVPVNQNDLVEYISLKERNFNDFLKRRVRNVKFKKKY